MFGLGHYVPGYVVKCTSREELLRAYSLSDMPRHFTLDNYFDQDEATEHT